ncbi:MAG: tRNA lysidine(34) synthetase TilS [Bacilli bacterium]|nr:tRNA lysidine(34) synthetase TilS [Bacilli bacterium]
MLKQFDRTLIQGNDVLLLAVSGGIDSMVMLHYMYHIAPTMNLTLAVAHMDHQKRNDSNLDSQLILNTCKRMNINCFIKKLEVNDDVNFHDYAHIRRYEFFYDIAKQINANKVVLAHNANDNAETILMRINRGSSFEGYRGILPKSQFKDMDIIRPLLSVSRKDISVYQKEHNIEFNEDSSNLNDVYTRNRYRHHVIPVLEQENPRFLEKFKQFSDYQTKAYQLIEKYADLFLADNLIKYKDSLAIDVVPFHGTDEIIQLEVIKRIVNQKTDNTVELSYANLIDIRDLFFNEKPHVELTLDENLHIDKSYNMIYFMNKKTNIQDYHFVLDEPKEQELPDGGLVIITKNPNKYYGIMYKLCYNNLDFIFPLTIRNRIDGDKIITDSGTKKLKDVFINQKTPMKTRNNIPIVCDKNQNIIWVPGFYESKQVGNQILYLIYQEGNRNVGEGH